MTMAQHYTPAYVEDLELELAFLRQLAERVEAAISGGRVTSEELREMLEIIRQSRKHSGNHF